MADVNANIGVNIDTSLALAQLKSLQRQISQFHTSIARSSETAALAQKSLQKNFLNSVNAIGSFSAELRTVKSTTESFTSSLEGNKFSMREYFRYAGGATKTFGRLFKSEFDTIGKVAEERVKRLQTQYIKMGRDASGAMQAVSIMPTSLDMENYGTRTAIAAQKQALFNQLMKQGSTNLLNFGKNTQWAGRQLMVGFTIPLAMVGSAATKTFMDMEAQAIKFKKVYGDLFTPEEETQQALENIKDLGRSFTQYGVAVSTTVGLAAEAAAAGFSGIDLQRQTTEATRLSILGQLDTQKALETTISLQNAFGMSSAKLAESIDFLNAVENQTVVSLDDITTAIPKVAPVIQQLGGDVKDLTFFMAAMKEGGINASEGANALKSGLGSLINPTGRAAEMLKSFGINATDIVTKNKGNLKATVVEFAEALNELDPLNRAQVIEQMFGKFQFARLSTLFANVAKDGNQAARVLDLANSSVEELASLSEKELGLTAESSMNKFKKTVEDLKFALIPVGQAFLEAVTPIVEFAGSVLEKFSNLSDGTKKAITIITVAIGAIGPVALMAFGLLANGVANIIKLFLTLRNGYLRLTGQSQVLGESTQYLTMEQIEAAAASHSLNQAHATLTQQFTAESAAVNQLILAYQGATKAGAAFAMANPGSMMPRPRGYAKGVVSVPGSGKGDTVPAMLTPGEAVIPAAMAKKYAPLISAMISGNIPGYQDGVTSIAQQFISTRVGRSASGGERAQVNVPGGYQLGHFAEPIQVTGAQLQALVATQAQSVRRAVEALINSVGGNLESIFDIFTNQVTVQSKELNQALGEAGSGKAAPVEMFRQESVGGAGAYNAPLIREMEKAGATTEEVESAVSQLAKEFTSGIEELGEVTTVTAEDVNRITKAAYDKVATLNEKVKKAQQELEKPGAIKEVSGVTAGRVSFAGGYNTSTTKKAINEVVQQQAPGMFPTQQAFNFTGEAARKVGVQNAVAIRQIFDQLDQEAKSRIFNLLGDIDAMSQQVITEAQNAGIDIGKYAVLGVADGAETESPSKKTLKVGEDVGKGLELGMESRKDDVAKVGESLGKTATQSTSRGAKTAGPITPGQPYNIDKTQSGVTVSQVARNVPISPEIAAKAAENARITQTATERLRGLDRNIMGASFAISSLSGIASMTGGKLGEMSGTISKVTGAMFALQAITGLLTQTNMIALAQKRAEIAGLVVGNVATKKMGFNTTLFAGGIKKLLPNLLNFGKVIARFLGPIGLAITAFGATVSIIKMVNAARERERLAIEGLADAMTLTTDKVKTLAGLLGQTPTPRAGSGARVSANQLDAEEQNAVDELRKSEDFLKTYKKDILAIKNATVAEAQIAFNAIALDLSGQGFTDKAIKTYIDALGEEAGKTEVSLKFKKIDLSNESGKKAVVDLAKDVTKELDKAFKGKIIPIPLGDNLSAGATVTSKIDITKKQQKALNVSSAALANTFAGLTSAFGNQTIKADEYNTKMAEIAKTIPQGTVGMMLMDKILLNVSPKFAAASAGIKDYDTKMLLLRASLVNASVAQTVFQNLMSNDPKIVAAARAELEKYRTASDALANQVVVTTKDFEDQSTAIKEKSPFQQAIEQLKQQKKEMLNTVKAYSSLRAAGVGAGKAFEVAKDPILAAAVATTKVGTKKWKELIKLIKETDAALIKSKLTELRADRDYTKQFTAIVPVLKNLGLNAEEIQNIFGDPTFAQQFIKNVKNGKIQVKDLKNIVDVTMQNRNAKLTFETSLKTEDELFDEAMSKANEMFDKVQAGIEAQYRGQISAGEAAVTKAQDNISKVQEDIDKIQVGIDKKQRDIEINITREIEKYQTQIDGLQNTIKEKFDTPLQRLSDEGDILSNTLSLIDRQTSKINEKYDAQAAALTKVSEINSEIANQQKQQLGLADALSRGDIAAAAAAAQEMRATAAANAQGRQSGVLESARSAELAGVTVNGMTRAQIEERQFQISQQSFALQQQRKVLEQSIADIEAKQIAPLNAARLAAEIAIRVEEDKIYKIQQERLVPAQAALTIAEGELKKTEAKLKADLAIIEQNKQSWIDAKTARDLALLDQENYKEALVKTDGVAKGVLDKILALNTTVKTIHNIHTVHTSSGGTGSSASTSRSSISPGAPQFKAYGGKIIAMNAGGMVPKYMALGGAVGSDTVPAMLTPGEFVMNRGAVKRFGPMLENMNNSKYPSMIKDLTPTTYTNVNSSMVTPIVNNVSSSVSDNSSTMYNYNVGINVNESNASSSDIARAVIGQIKYIDSQRIRGQR
jgi:TP901 family phage tail tape measure protein